MRKQVSTFVFATFAAVVIAMGLFAAVARVTPNRIALAQEGNPCQADINTPVTDPNRLAFHIEDIDKLGVTTLEYVIFQGDGTEPLARVSVPRASLAPATLNGVTFINCHVLDNFVAPGNLARDGKTPYFVQARTGDAQQRVSAWSTRSNPFVLGTIVTPPPLPLPVPGVRVGRKSS
jgi:hypothetical protein